MQIKWPHRGESKLRNSSVPEDCFILENNADPGSPLFIKVPVVGFQYTWGNKKHLSGKAQRQCNHGVYVSLVLSHRPSAIA